MKNIAAILLCLFLVSNVFAKNRGNGGDTGLGLQACFPVWGASVVGNLSSDFSIQGILGILGNFKSYGGRIRYHFSDSDEFRSYTYGLLGAFSHTSFIQDKTETIFGYGAGVGIEFTDERWQSGKPVWINLEIGYGNLDFKTVSFSAIMIGTGVHYYF